MNRRGFLGLVGAGAAGFVLDPEQLLWRPGAKTIFLPSIVTPVAVPIVGAWVELITREALGALERNLVFVQYYDRDRALTRPRR